MKSAATAFKRLQEPTINRRRQYLDHYAEDKRILILDDWYNVNYADLRFHSRAGIVYQYHDNLVSCLAHTYPDMNWKPWRFKQVSAKVWQLAQHQREAIEYVSEVLSVKELDAWAGVTIADCVNAGLGGLIQTCYKGSLTSCLSTLYPEHVFSTWLTDSLNNVAMDLKINCLDDWYYASITDAVRGGARLLIERYETLANCVSIAYPHHSWQLHKFESMPLDYWSNEQNQALALNEISQELNIKSLSEWYNYEESKIRVLLKMHVASGLLSYFDGSVSALLKSSFPGNSGVKRVFKRKSLNWAELFKRIPLTRPKKQKSNNSVELFDQAREDFKTRPFTSAKKSYWLHKGDDIAFLSSVKANLRITNPEMWYRVPTQLLTMFGGRKLMKNWPHVLKNVEPNFPFVWENFATSTKQHKQTKLKGVIQSIFPNCTVMEETTVELMSTTKSGVVVDVYVPYHNLAIEYQGEQHYKDVFKWHSSNVQRLRDSEKKQLCEDSGVVLVPIPFWWSGDRASIMATLMYYKPSLNLNVSKEVAPLLDSDFDFGATNMKIMSPGEGDVSGAVQ